MKTPKVAASFSAEPQLWVRLDRLRAERTRRSGKRPRIGQLIVEAVEAFLVREERLNPRNK